MYIFYIFYNYITYIIIYNYIYINYLNLYIAIFFFFLIHATNGSRGRYANISLVLLSWYVYRYESIKCKGWNAACTFEPRWIPAAAAAVGCCNVQVVKYIEIRGTCWRTSCIICTRALLARASCRTLRWDEAH